MSTFEERGGGGGGGQGGGERGGDGVLQLQLLPSEGVWKVLGS